MKPAGLHASRAQQRPGKGTGHGKHHAAIANTQNAHAVAPLFGRALGFEGVFNRGITLKNNAFGFAACDGFAWQHKGAAVPADTVSAACEFIRRTAL